MRFYTGQHRFLLRRRPAREDDVRLRPRRRRRDRLVQRNCDELPRRSFTDASPYRDGLVVACRVSCFTWYWLADLCATEKIAFVFGWASGYAGSPC